MTSNQNPRDKQAPHTPDSRSDREAHVGGGNQSRRGPVGTSKR